MNPSLTLKIAFSALFAFGMFVAWTARTEVHGRLDSIESTMRGARSRVSFEWPHGLVEIGLEQSGDGGSAFVDEACATFDSMAAKYPPKRTAR